MNIGNIVVRKSYNKDIKFKIVDINDIDGKKNYILKGENIRIIADSKESDLEIVKNKKNDLFSLDVKEKLKQLNSKNSSKNLRDENKNYRCEDRVSKGFKKRDFNFGKSGRVLHVDGDSDYLNKCIGIYEELSVSVCGECIDEFKQPEVILDLVEFYKPDIVVLTGHDSMSKDIEDYLDLNFYKNSKYFVDSVKQLREYERDLDNLIIFAGACQSCYELLIEAGANFATSPRRVLVHCLDPVFVCYKIFKTSIDKTVKIDDVLNDTITGFNGVGGVQTRGKYREGFPKSFYI